MIRKATYSGSWYNSNKDKLKKQFSKWLDNVSKKSKVSTRAIISPHAGLEQCGKTQSHVYSEINSSIIKTVIILGPSHHTYLSNCAVTVFDKFETPFGNINIDTEKCHKLQMENPDLFTIIDMESEENEHSIELNLPFLKYMLIKNDDFKLIPIIVGNINNKKEMAIGKILSEQLNDKTNLIIISSDFCHWGERFNQTYNNNKENLQIQEFIKDLDNTGMKLIENQKASKFKKQLKETNNTICGKHPIMCLLQALNYSKYTFRVNFVYYDQSNKATKDSESSVSYASAVIYENTLQENELNNGKVCSSPYKNN